jgi:hypothetical protein
VEDFGSSVWRGTTEIFAQVKEAVLSIDEEAATTTHSDALATPFSNAKYSRYESQVITNKNSCKGSSCFRNLYSEQLLVFAKLAMHMNICLIHVDIIPLGRGKHC